MSESFTLAFPRAPVHHSGGCQRALRVLHVIAPSSVGGLERVVSTLTRAQLDAGIEARVAAVIEPEAQENPVVAELRAAGVGVHEVRVLPRAYRVERRAIRELCECWRPDVLHSHGYRSDLVDSRVAQRLGIPRVTTMHGFTGGDLRNRVYEWLQRREARRMHAVIAVSRALGHRLAAAGIVHERLHVVPNAYSPRPDFADRSSARQRLGLPDEAFVVGWVGRLTREKGADVLVDSVPLLEDATIVASVIGDGKERMHLVERATSRAPRRVHWHGMVLDAAHLLRAFDVFVLSSRTEGTPMVLFEAMNAGVPIIATRVGGVPDVLRPEDAVLIDPDDPVGLAAAIDGVARDRAAAQLRASSARERLSAEYSTAPWVERHTAIYHRTIGSTAPQ